MALENNRRELWGRECCNWGGGLGWTEWKGKRKETHLFVSFRHPLNYRHQALQSRAALNGQFANAVKEWQACFWPLCKFRKQRIEWKRQNSALLWHETFIFCLCSLCIFSFLNYLFLWKFVWATELIFKGNCNFLSHSSDFFLAIARLHFTIQTFFSKLQV